MKSQVWVYLKAKGEELWTVGFYDPTGKWIPESDHESTREAGDQVAWLNGGSGKPRKVSGYTTDQIVSFLQKSYCLESFDFAEFLGFVNDGKQPSEDYIDAKYKTLQSDPGMFLCHLDPARREKFIEWILGRK